MKLKTALSCSALIHLGFLALKPPVGLVPPKETLRALQVTYLPVEAAAPQEKSPPARKASPPPKFVLPSAPAGRGGEAPKAPSINTAPRAETSQAAPSRRSETPRPIVSPLPDATQKPVTGPESAAATAQAVRLPPEGAFARIQHKHQVKEHLRNHLRYPSTRSQGWVRLQVFLDRAGGLKLLRVLGSSHPALAQKAMDDARTAIPYPSFPRSLGGQQVRYEFVVQYEPE